MKDQKRSGWNDQRYSSDIPYGDAGYGLSGRPTTWRADCTLPPEPVRAVDCVIDGGRPNPDRDESEILASPAKKPRRSRTRS